MSKGDAKTGNKHARQRAATFKKLCARGNAGRDALTVLFCHPSPDVRSMAAAYLLRYRTQEAIAVLEEVARGQGLIAFEAGQALKHWNEGTWTIDAE